MRKFLQNISRKPKAVKERYAFYFASVFVGVVTFIWVLSLPSRFGTTVTSVENKGNSPFATFMGEMSGQLSNAKENLDLVGEQMAAVASSSDGAQGIILTNEDIDQIKEKSDTAPAYIPPTEEEKSESVGNEGVPVMIGTTTATTTYSATSTP